MAQFLSTYFLVLLSAQLVKSSGVFELKVHSFTTSSSDVCKQSRDCQFFFRVCLNYTDNVISYRLACSNGTGLTGTMSTDQSSISTSEPITLPFKLKWLDVHLGEQSELCIGYRVVCDKFYYGDECSDFCRSRDDPYGHFTCDDTGSRICLPEWKGEYCAEPICSSGCSEEHGYCEAPSQCKCFFGWQGPRCDECTPYPGCLHGTCVRPWQCTCKKGWGEYCHSLLSINIRQDDNEMAQFLSTYFLVLISAQLVKSSGVFELKVHSFTTSNSSVCKHNRDCDVFFHVCLSYTQDVISYRLGCSNGTGVSVTFSTGQSFISTCAPISVPFNLRQQALMLPRFTCQPKRLRLSLEGVVLKIGACLNQWITFFRKVFGLSLQGTVSVIIQAWDAESSNEQPTENLNNIGHFATKINLTNSQKWSQHVHLGEQSELRLSYRVVCNKFYYGDDCLSFCRSRDDVFGHFTCDNAGNIICLPGWKGEECKEAICSSGCREEHGYCEAPGQCKCFEGWQGPHCDECRRYPACVHGTCEHPWQCNCEEGWGGLFCDMDLNV
ncbi:Delta-like protein C [Labeo rohita]|uniref:Delta-like protein n=1 Tax=Labeo rohita TaxID=84645 RepID=A0ABQ8N0B7_LABRO|nr:Delta-like protein C [Labeo rohita]